MKREARPPEPDAPSSTPPPPDRWLRLSKVVVLVYETEFFFRSASYELGPYPARLLGCCVGMEEYE